MTSLDAYQIPHDPRSTHQLHWTPGGDGKGILSKDGTLHTWNTWRQDGDPNHRRYMMESPAFGYDPYGSGFRGDDDHMYFWIAPDGKVDLLNRYSDHEAIKSIPQIDPRLYRPDGSLWHFGDARNQQRALSEPQDLGPTERQRWDEDGDVQSPFHSRQIEWVPTHELKKFMEYDRRPGGAHATDPARFEAMRQHIAEHGFKSPIGLEFNPDTGMAHMGEGNHRTAIALDLGIPAMPVKVIRSRRTSPTQIPVNPQPDPSWADPYDPTGHHWPDVLKPSHIGLPTTDPWHPDGWNI